MLYQNEVNWLINDLHLDGLGVRIKYVNRPSVSRARTNVGLYIRGERTAVVAIGGLSRETIVTTLAHELRHAHQYLNNVMTYTDIFDREGQWAGSVFAPPESSFRIFDGVTNFTAYRAMPHEVDARAYETYAWSFLVLMGSDVELPQIELGCLF